MAARSQVDETTTTTTPKEEVEVEVEGRQRTREVEVEVECGVDWRNGARELKNELELAMA
jgi:hypothetical protein